MFGKTVDGCVRTQSECDKNADTVASQGLDVSTSCHSVKAAWVLEAYDPVPMLKILSTKAACDAEMERFGGERCYTSQ